MPALSVKAYAKHRGVGLATVQQAVRDGRIKLTDGKVDPEQADQEWSKNSTPVIARQDPNSISYMQSRAERESYLARLAKIEFEERVANLVSAEEVRVASYSMARKVRDAFTNLADRISGTLAAENDPARVHSLLSTEIRRALTELSNDGDDGE